MRFIKIAILFLSLIPCLILPRDNRETTERRAKRYRALAAKNSALFLKIAFLKKLPPFLKRLTHFLKLLTIFLKTFTPFLKHLTLCTSFAFLHTLSMPLCPLVPNLIRVFHASEQQIGTNKQKCTFLAFFLRY